jgi:hypothetical protein
MTRPFFWMAQSEVVYSFADKLLAEYTEALIEVIAFHALNNYGSNRIVPGRPRMTLAITVTSRKHPKDQRPPEARRISTT